MTPYWYECEQKIKALEAENKRLKSENKIIICPFCDAEWDGNNTPKSVYEPEELK